MTEVLIRLWSINEFQSFVCLSFDLQHQTAAVITDKTLCGQKGGRDRHPRSHSLSPHSVARQNNSEHVASLFAATPSEAAQPLSLSHCPPVLSPTNRRATTSPSSVWHCVCRPPRARHCLQTSSSSAKLLEPATPPNKKGNE